MLISLGIRIRATFDRVSGFNNSAAINVDLPVVSHVTVATPAAPFLGLMLAIDPRTIVQLAAEMERTQPKPQPPKECSYRAMSIGELEPLVLDALIRLVRLLDEPKLIPQVAPLIQQEIAVRLLAGTYSPRLRQLVAAGSSVSRSQGPWPGSSRISRTRWGSTNLRRMHS